MATFYAYIYRHPMTGVPFYVGKGKDDRYRDHLRPSVHKSNRHMKNTIQKILREHGCEPHIEIIDAIDEQHALFLEKCLIAIFGRRDLGTGTLCNLTDGGEGQSHASPETRKKMSESAKRAYQCRSDEHKTNLYRAHKGAKRSAEARETMRAAWVLRKQRQALEEAKR